MALGRFNPDAPTLRTHSAISVSCKAAMYGDRWNGGQGSGAGLRARGLEPAAEAWMRHFQEGGDLR